MTKIREVLNEFFSDNYIPDLLTKTVDELENKINTEVQKAREEARKKGWNEGFGRSLELESGLSLGEIIELSKDKDEETKRVIRQIREEAVRGFADWCDSLSYEYEDSGGNAMVMEELVKTYLQSLDKGDTDERN